MSNSFVPKYTSAHEMFRVVQEYQKLNISALLKQLLKDKKISIADLSKRLNDYGYNITQESLYRYFNPNQQTNRFPSQDFIEVFSKVMELTDEETITLMLFWKHSKLLKKYKCLILP